MKIAILASGNGTNFQALAEKFQSGEIPGELSLLFCDHPDAYVVERAKKLKVPYESFTVKECGGKKPYEERLLDLLNANQIDFLILAGYMRVIGAEIIKTFENSIINLHPAYLPEYPGLHSIERAFEDHVQNGRTETGVTVHYVDCGLDSGPIIAQRHVPIYDEDTVDELEERVHECEHILFPQTIKRVLNDRIAYEKGSN